MLRQCVGYDFSGAITVTCKMGEVEVNGTGSVLRFAENDAAKKMLDLLDSEAHPEKAHDEETPGSSGKDQTPASSGKDQAPASSENIQTPPKVNSDVNAKEGMICAFRSVPSFTFLSW